MVIGNFLTGMRPQVPDEWGPVVCLFHDHLTCILFKGVWKKSNINLSWKRITSQDGDSSRCEANFPRTPGTSNPPCETATNPIFCRISILIWSPFRSRLYGLTPCQSMSIFPKNGAPDRHRRTSRTSPTPSRAPWSSASTWTSVRWPFAPRPSARGTWGSGSAGASCWRASSWVRCSACNLPLGNARSSSAGWSSNGFRQSTWFLGKSWGWLDFLVSDVVGGWDMLRGGWVFQGKFGWCG